MYMYDIQSKQTFMTKISLNKIMVSNGDSFKQPHRTPNTYPCHMSHNQSIKSKHKSGPDIGSHLDINDNEK